MQNRLAELTTADRHKLENRSQIVSPAAVRGAVEIPVRIDCQASLWIGSVVCASSKTVEHRVPASIVEQRKHRTATFRAVKTAATRFRGAVDDPARWIVKEIAQRIGAVCPAGKIVERGFGTRREIRDAPQQKDDRPQQT